MTAEATENRRNRHKRQKRHRKLLKEQRLASRGLLNESALAPNASAATGSSESGGGADQIRHDICWDFVKSGGKCYRGDSCQYTHEMVPLHQIPVKLRL